MGGIWTNGGEYVAALAETVGYKSGLALNRERIRRILASDDRMEHPWPRDDDAMMRFRAEEYEAAFAWLLFRVGSAASPRTMTLFDWILLRTSDPKLGPIARDLLDEQDRLVFQSARDAPGKPIDITPLLPYAERHGIVGRMLVRELISFSTGPLARPPRMKR